MVCFESKKILYAKQAVVLRDGCCSKRGPVGFAHGWSVTVAGPALLIALAEDGFLFFDFRIARIKLPLPFWLERLRFLAWFGQTLVDGPGISPDLGPVVLCGSLCPILCGSLWFRPLCPDVPWAWRSCWFYSPVGSVAPWAL